MYNIHLMCSQRISEKRTGIVPSLKMIAGKIAGGKCGWKDVCCVLSRSSKELPTKVFLQNNNSAI